MRRLAHGRSDVKQYAGEQVCPVGEGIQSRKRHISGADHQGNQKDRKARQDWRGIPEDHGDAVHGKNLIVALRTKDVLFRSGELDAHQERFKAANQEEDKGSHHIPYSKVLVVYSRKPASDSLRSFPQFCEALLDGERTHCLLRNWDAARLALCHEERTSYRAIPRLMPNKFIRVAPPLDNDAETVCIGKRRNIQKTAWRNMALAANDHSRRGEPRRCGSDKSSLAFGTLYAEAQRRYLESVSPYARRLFHQMAVPEVDSIEGLPPAVALQQQRGSPTTRSSVGSVTTLSNLIRMLYSRAGEYPPQQTILMPNPFR